MTDFKALLRILSDASVEFIVIGGVAAAVHGSARATFDLDVVYRRTPEKINRGLNFTLTTDVGALDLLGEITGGGSYEALAPSTEVIRAFGIECRLLDLNRLIEVKRAVGRPKDFETVAELEIIREQRRRSST